jgi:ribokinase
MGRAPYAGNIVVFGSLNADLVVNVPRLPRPAETVMGKRLETFAGGKGANQAVAAARLGGDVRMVGRVGADAFGDMLLASLATDGVDTSAVERDAREPTGAALILVEQGGQNMIAVAPGANGRVEVADAGRAAALLDSRALLVLQLEVPLAAIEAAIDLAASRGSRVVLNAAPAMTTLAHTLLRSVDVLVVNELEASALAGRAVATMDDADAAARSLMNQGVRAVIITLGAAGAVLGDQDGVGPVAAYRVEAVDATAAGDAFVGALAVGLSRGAGLARAASLGAAAGAAAASRPGAQSSLPRREDLEAVVGAGPATWISDILA